MRSKIDGMWENFVAADPDAVKEGILKFGSKYVRIHHVITNKGVKLTQQKVLAMDSLFKGYADGIITDDSLYFMLDITLGEISCVDVKF